jgi:hypothetical protein
MTLRSFVKVERVPFGFSQFSDSSLALTDDDTLTVTRNDTGAVVERFAAERWRTASVYDGDGHYLHSFTNGAPVEPLTKVGKR